MAGKVRLGVDHVPDFCHAMHAFQTRPVRHYPAAGLFYAGLTGLLLALPAPAAEWLIEGRVVGVSDGDTITVLDDAKTQHKIRFAGIDAPEKGQEFGERSKQSLSALVFQKRVEARCHKKDRYGREVRAVFIGLRDVGLEQIRQGMAWHYKDYQHEQTTHDRLVYRDEEESAKARRIGLWKDAQPLPPWQYRSSKNREK